MKAILLDIDGTLLNSQKIITSKTKEALLKAQASGIRLAIVSARTQNGLNRFGRELQFEKYHGIYIACNGAHITDAQTKKIIYSKMMSKDLVKDILEHLKKFNVTVLIAHKEYMYTNDVYGCHITLNNKDFDVIQYESRNNEYLLCEKRDLASFWNWDCPKILVAGQPEYLQEVHEQMAAPFKDVTTHGFTAPFYYEFNPKGVSKPQAIQIVFESMGICPEEMMAFGDQKNDISMIQYVKYGIAMGNAIDECKQVAYDITLDNDHDGIAHAIYKYIPEIQ
ncbi:Cof-type HAD-IIB family hydrolase [Floccifex sp.]|uniref:Cof-type HAD-IIB family hydrolase n=1 Tax=Floccifex sp. TaxID=2815810 RepID=UPI003F00C42B